MPKSTPEGKRRETPYQSSAKKHRRGLAHSTPLFDADPILNTLGKTEARASNDARLQIALAQVAGPAPTHQVPHHCGHPVSKPRLDVGKSNTLNAGRWYQLVCSMSPYCCRRNVEDNLVVVCSPRFIVQALPHHARPRSTDFVQLRATRYLVRHPQRT
jgi:hypothetical protein